MPALCYILCYKVYWHAKDSKWLQRNTVTAYCLFIGSQVFSSQLHHRLPYYLGDTWMFSLRGGGQVCKKESGLCHSLVQYPHREESEEGKGQHSFQVSPNIDEGNSCQVRWAGCWQVAQQGDLWEAYVLSYLERSSRPCYLFGGQCCITLTHLFKPSNDVAPRDNLWHALSLYTFCVHFTYLSEDKFLLQTCLSFI